MVRSSLFAYLFYVTSHLKTLHQISIYLYIDILQCQINFIEKKLFKENNIFTELSSRQYFVGEGFEEENEQFS